MNAATDERAVREFGPIAGTYDAAISRSYMQDTVGIAAKGIVLDLPRHQTSNAPRQESRKQAPLFVYL